MVFNTQNQHYKTSPWGKVLSDQAWALQVSAEHENAVSKREWMAYAMWTMFRSTRKICCLPSECNWEELEIKGKGERVGDFGKRMGKCLLIGGKLFKLQRTLPTSREGHDEAEKSLLYSQLHQIKSSVHSLSHSQPLNATPNVFLLSAGGGLVLQGHWGEKSDQSHDTCKYE